MNVGDIVTFTRDEAIFYGKICHISNGDLCGIENPIVFENGEYYRDLFNRGEFKDSLRLVSDEEWLCVRLHVEV